MIHKQLFTVLLSALFVLAACGRSEPEAPTADEPMDEPAAESTAAGAMDEPADEPMADSSGDLREKLASESRPAGDRARDAGRKPADVVEFLGIEPGMRVMDIIAAGGYYTEVLSLAVGHEGEVVAQNPPGLLESRESMEEEISGRLANGRLPNVTRLNVNLGEFPAGTENFDAAITALNFHDIYNRNGPEAAQAALQSIYSVLKPGGVLGIIDHAGVAGADNAELHRIEKEKAIEAAVAAGFEVEQESNLLSNAADDHTQGVFAEGLRGNTDRFALKLRKPAG